jgi:hypothetical protein
MDRASRTRLVALAVLLCVSVPLVVVAASGSGGFDERPAALRVERNPSGLPELIVYVEDRSLNRAATAGGARRVTVECENRAGEVLFRQPERWPFSDTDGATTDPHAHLGIDPARLGRITRCRLAGTDPPLEGRLP